MFVLIKYVGYPIENRSDGCDFLFFFFSFIIGIRVEHDDEDELENRQIDVKYSIIGNLSRMIFRNLPTRHVPFVYPSYPTRCKL